MKAELWGEERGAGPAKSQLTGWQKWQQDGTKKILQSLQEDWHREHGKGHPASWQRSKSHPGRTALLPGVVRPVLGLRLAWGAPHVEVLLQHLLAKL